MTNRTHPPTPTARIMAELSSAAVAVTEDSADPLAPVTALAPVPETPEAMVVAISQEEEVYSLRLAGYTVPQIAHHMTKKLRRRVEYSEVDEWVASVGKANMARTAAQLGFAAQLELDRIEEALKALWPAVQEGNLLATDRFLKLSQAKREMLGLDAPDVKLQLTLGNESPADYSALSTEELKTLLELQKRVTSAGRAKVVTSK